MSYSYTEKKRIRKNFGRFPKVMDLPTLTETQLNSYAMFLQANVDPDKRENIGLEEVFQSLFPITSVSGNAALEYVSYELGKNSFDVQECLIQGLSYSAPLRIKVRLVIYDKESNFEEVKDVKEGEVFMGEVPLMTSTGSFIINGTGELLFLSSIDLPEFSLIMTKERLTVLGKFYTLQESFHTEVPG